MPKLRPFAPPVLLRGGEVITMDEGSREGSFDVLLAEGRIQAVGRRVRRPRGATVLECGGTLVLPGLIQAHVHLCQTLFRHRADGLALLAWLRERIWPFEAAHTAASLRASAELGIAELLLSGTTAVLDMGTVHHTEELFQAAEASGLRYVGGKAMMDTGEGVPAGLRETTDDSLADSLTLARRFHGVANGRLRYAFCPRFLLSCTAELLREVADLSARDGLTVHSHASESAEEGELVRRLCGRDNIAALDAFGLHGDRLVLAHCIHLTAAEEELLARTRTHAVHCPGANLKLASGTMPLPRLLARGVNVAIGADGAACNNTLDVFHELRLAGSVHLPSAGANGLSPRDVLALATTNGARALGLATEVGSLSVGKAADVTVVDLGAPRFHPRGADAVAMLVYAAQGSDVRDVFVEGRQLVERGRLTSLSLPAVLRRAEAEAKGLRARARRGLARSEPA